MTKELNHLTDIVVEVTVTATHPNGVREKVLDHIVEVEDPDTYSASYSDTGIRLKAGNL